MSSLEDYLVRLHQIHASGAAVRETSYYDAVANLFNYIGRGLRPRVHCITQISQGAGIPDAGFFTSDQLRADPEARLARGQIPARGVLEVKGPGDDVLAIAHSSQVREKYWEKYRQVLVTNLRDFLLVGRDADGDFALLERYTLAESEAAFWAAAANPEPMVEEHGERFREYLKRVLLYAAPLTTPKDVAWLLASYAREALARVERSELPALAEVRSTLEQALGLRFQGARGEHFFRSTLVQTLFYGVFSAWVLWSKERPWTSKARFDWRAAEWSLRVPMIRALFEQLSVPSRLEPLRLVEVLDWTGSALHRVDRAAFFSRFEEKHAVQYFYEPFLEAFDPDLRRQLGVWYTPTEVVEYMVARVDTVLREEMGLPDGLADPNVYVLDPCTGTGSYLVEVLRRICETLQAQGGDALVGQDLKRAAMERVFGFEILPAPFVVAHLQLGLLLQSYGAPLSDTKRERVGVYLTNALTGWEPPTEAKQRLLFREMEEERDAAEEVKQNKPILVVLGNPPYSGFAGIAVDEERDLSTAYRTTRRAPAPQGQGLNDLYVRFFRMAERRIVEQTGKGIVCFISNYSWLDGLSFSGMRERYLEAFDHIWIDNLNGDKYRTGKLTPEGEPDPSVFSTPHNPEGIQVGTAIALLVRKEPHEGSEVVGFRKLWGRTKRAQLQETAEQNGESLYQQVRPSLDLGLPFKPGVMEGAYLSWPLLPQLFPVSFPGVKTSRDDVVVDIDRERLVRRMQQYFDPGISHTLMRRVAPGAMTSTTRFNAEATRTYLLTRGFLSQNIVRYCYRPFDVRWLYWEPRTKLLDEKRADYFAQVFDANVWLASTTRIRNGVFYQPQVTAVLADLNVIEANVQMFPLYR
jgi:hypothetical protein